MLNPTAVLARGRAAAVAVMQDTCTIQRRTGSTTDQTYGTVAETYAQTYAGQCRFQTPSGGGPSDLGEAAVYETQLILQLPITVVDVQPEDLVTCVTSADPALVGRTWRTRAPQRKTHATMRRVELVDVED